MKRFALTILLFTCLSFTAMADHITGGEMYYTYAGMINGNHVYNVTLKLFMRCNSGRFFADPNTISVFNRNNNMRLSDISVALSQQVHLELPDAGPCISNPPTVCYEVGYYDFTVALPPSSSGYLLASQVNYRIAGISNLEPFQVGATYTCEIPGTAPVSGAPVNSSARFTGSDLVVVCANNFFSYSFAAQDPDGDELQYSFCSAYISSNSGTGGVPPGNPPYSPVPYASPTYSESAPLGPNVTVNSNTGLITGIAPAQGIYVVTVCVQEIRNGTVIATQRKDIQINVADCNIAAARLQPDYMLCRNTRTIALYNQSNSPLITTYEWTVFDPGGTTIFTTNNTFLDYTFPANGIYSVRLIVNKSQQCNDSARTLVYVFPGFKPDFNYTGICFTKPSQFTDLSTTITGIVDSWKWDFGEPTTALDISTLRNPSYTYPTLGSKQVRLIATNTDGCRDTVFKTVSIIEKPPITFAFRDTLICLNDQLQLQASGMGNFTWSPLINIINPNSPNPTVSPTSTTTYYADLNSDGCLNRDSVKVRVVDHVSLLAMPDTTICSGDTIQLRVISDGLQYQWQPAGQLINPSAKNPFAITPLTTVYRVKAIIGGCAANSQVAVTAIPYPVVNAGKDTVVCYNSPAQLQAITNGTSWEWTPTASLSDPASLNPVALPGSTTVYVFAAIQAGSGCPKPSRDTVIVSVLPKISASAGRDTSVVIGQELQLNASGGISYLWTPPFNLSSPTIANPVALFNEPIDRLVYRVHVFNSAGCVDSAFIAIRVFATLPTVFVPTAFTPNGDGKNDRLIPIAVGMQRIEYFRIYNRWGQLVFSTNSEGQGWDGRINGQLQGSNTYVWMVKAVDFKGGPYFLKGHVTLIR